MKIGIVIEHGSMQRASRYVLEASKYFASQGHQVHIFANRWQPVDEENIIFHKIHLFTSNFYLRQMMFSLFVTILLKFHSFDATLSQPTRYFSPDVAEMQFVYKAWADYKKRNGMHRSLHDLISPLIERHNLEKAKRIIAISNSVKNEVVKLHGIPPKKIHVVYSGVDLEEFNLENKSLLSKETRKKHGIKPSDMVMLFVGSPFVRKGLSTLLEAFGKIRKENSKLVIVGGKGDDTSQYKRLAHQLGVAKRTIFVERSENIFEYFSAADIFVLPTLYDPFGLVVLESMASGVPVVVSRLAGASELIKNGREGVLIDDPKDSDEIAEKLNRLINDSSLRKKMGLNARKTAEKYTWQRTAEGMLRILEEAAK